MQSTTYQLLFSNFSTLSNATLWQEAGAESLDVVERCADTLYPLIIQNLPFIIGVWPLLYRWNSIIHYWELLLGVLLKVATWARAIGKIVQVLFILSALVCAAIVCRALYKEQDSISTQSIVNWGRVHLFPPLNVTVV